MTELQPSHQAVAKKLYEMLDEEPTSDINTKLGILESIKAQFHTDIATRIDKLKFEQDQLTRLMHDKF